MTHASDDRWDILSLLKDRSDKSVDRYWRYILVRLEARIMRSELVSVEAYREILADVVRSCNEITSELAAASRSDEMAPWDEDDELPDSD